VYFIAVLLGGYVYINWAGRTHNLAARIAAMRSQFAKSRAVGHVLKAREL